ncbi:WecB/TagA/CpsF family glycosyltransferase [Arvimicrobium flavum]|uniref:WecB/TagA/CpsF family glycosyltransferase n=1 Tax=Arvimicrobium flavum TaxID=3393320 RepID=UPI00237A0C96|nr:WecB/TagA/CpsF family glycosyltransferase [Mesorhizobium shangrilense]
MNVRASTSTATPVSYRDIVGVRVAALHWSAAIELMQSRIADRHHTKVAFLNAHVANCAAADREFKQALRDFLVLPDGVGVDIASKLLHGEPLPANLNGTDFVPALLSQTQTPLTVGLIGGRRANLDGAVAALRRNIPQHHYRAVADGFFSETETAAICADLAAERPDILLVAMGVPKQEKWIAQHLDQRHATLPLAVGALFDFFAGAVPRAPGWVRRLRCEWLFRLWIEPGRLWRRYLIGNPQFLWRVLKQKIAG